MKVMHLADSGNSPTLVEATLPDPQPGPGQVVIRVSAAGITPTELSWYPTTHDHAGAPRTAAVPSHEFSGTIAALGPGVHDFTLGQSIFGMNDWFAAGALAELCLTETSFIAPAPITLTPLQAASVPIGALTAWQGLFEHGHLHPGDRVLIHGAAGAVGHFAVQIAHLHGAHVIATASPATASLVRQLGANEIIDYQVTRFEDAITQPVDIVFDTVGGDTLLRSLPLVKPGRFAVTIASDKESSEDPRIKHAFFIVKPHQRQLMEIAALIDTGKLRTFVDAIVPFDKAGSAYNRKVANRKGHGKLVVAINPAVA
ncbi:NADP-dependent oxidoreductase [Edaphobacter modestus]|uniref:NADPH:quinone reductase-like Zn-dependent oxidoreductase n=1 Tax=Edaphobacter modestus TaxID=388466 RepID=A0A4V2G4K6_9BACT|nr:NADP-dependent oxidoreductase [Edaphobacter modestus]RZU41306.1 NADPH:quinone reductase-like Zn-dependent oxidoreductase [Edaphobacter modestus]